MAKKNGSARQSRDTGAQKSQIQRQVARTRESLAETVGEIKETVEQEVGMVKRKVSDILDYRDEFAKDPLVWSLGALSAGFALGYTLGYAHKRSKGAKRNEITAFADTMMDQLSSMGHGLVLPALDAKISELFGFDFSAMLDKVGTGKKTAKKKDRPRAKIKPAGKSGAKKRPTAKSKASRS